MFEIGQIFKDVYPPEAALWCNENSAFIDEIEPITKLVDEEYLVADEVYDEEGNLVSDAQYETKQVEKTIRRFQIVAIPEPTPEEIAKQVQKELTDAVQRVLDSKAQELNYDNCLSVCSYIETGVAKFDAEGKAFRAWRSSVWAKGYEILAQVQAGQRGIPTEAELISELPELVIVYDDASA